jgi:crotonobetainyl-CoA:carnitine CoA-transferase CaiB-like acyl-CoA transferase
MPAVNLETSDAPSSQAAKAERELDPRAQDRHQPPLTGVCVLDLSRVLAGPYCTMILADLGAEVVKIERPGAGDDTRQWGPPWAGGESAYYLSVNRNKRSVTLNLKEGRGRETLRQLAAQADVLVENFRVGTLADWGLGYEMLRDINPRLIACSITGYGQTGPYRERPGYDFVIQAEGGIMSITGPEEGPPMKVGVAIVDITAGMYAAISILAALHERERSGQGQAIDISLLDAQVAWLANVGSNYLISGERPGRYGNAHPNIVPYETLPTANGWIAVGVGNDGQWRRLCELGGWDDLAADERFATNPGRVTHRAVLVPVLQERFRARPAGEWQADLLEAGIPCSRINSIDEVFASPQVSAREMVVEVAHPTAGPLKIAGSPLKLSRTPVQLEGAPPLLGQHTDEVLGERLGLAAEELADLREAGII